MEHKTAMSEDFINSIILLFQKRIGLKQDAFNLHAWEGLIAGRMVLLNIKDEDVYFNLVTRSEDEFGALRELVIVPETWFFREPAALEHAAGVITSWGPKRLMRVLSVACSSGEEPFSLAMLLIRSSVPYAQYQIDAVDISEASIAEALRGIYRPNSFRGKNFTYRGRFFEKSDQSFAIKDEVKGMVNFFVGNAVDPLFMRGHGKYDLIFCRNLFIYLTPQSQGALLRRLSELLYSKGILYVGATEAEVIRQHGWSPIEPPSVCGFMTSKVDVVKQPFVPKIVPREVVTPVALIPAASLFPLEEASQLADQGFYQQALTVCLEYIGKSGKADPQAYFLMGVIEHACFMMEQAEVSFAKTIYLQPNHIEALTYLALLADLRGDKLKGDVYRQRLSRIGEAHE